MSATYVTTSLTALHTILALLSCVRCRHVGPFRLLLACHTFVAVTHRDPNFMLLTVTQPIFSSSRRTGRIWGSDTVLRRIKLERRVFFSLFFHSAIHVE